MTPALVGYARCSSSDQYLHLQVAELSRLGVAPSGLHQDHGYSGRTRDRPGLLAALAACRPGDTLVVTRADRLSRKAIDALNIAQELSDRGVSIAVGAMVFNLHHGTDRFMWTMLAATAEMEYTTLRSRTMAGVKQAQTEGKFRGRQPALSTEREREMVAVYRRGGISQEQLAVAFGISRPTVARILKRYPKPVVRALVS